MIQYHVLLGEDEQDILEYNKAQLEQRGYRVTAASELKKVEEALRRDRPDILVLDIMMPDGSGIDFCRKIREKFIGPILFLTALGERGQIVRGLRSGGDDYMVKPYSIEELAARIEAHIRRSQRSRRCAWELGGRLFLNGDTLRAFLDGEDMLLRPKEYQILRSLVMRMGTYVSAAELYTEIWGMDGNNDMRTIWVHISSLRRKLVNKEGIRIADIQCEKTKGYRLIMMDCKGGQV